MPGSQAIRCRKYDARFYPLLRIPREAYVGGSCQHFLDFPLAPSDKQDQGNLKPVPETKDAVAVALHQAKETDRAPKVVAAGRGTTAEQILEIAFSLGIRVREDADLAQLLSVVDEDSEIPTEAFAAVAEILVYLYRVNGDIPASSPQSGDTPSDTMKDLAETLAAKWRQENGASS